MLERSPYEEILAQKKRLGSRLVILAHHYQQEEIYRHADITGDSLELARRIAGLEAEYVIMCGVWFMAETAAILAKPGQKVFIPDEGSSCTMADMAPLPLVQRVMRRFEDAGRKVVPLAYVNSSAGVKALCGRLGGAVCTSANAKTMLAWALEQGDGVLFLPDMNLGRNMAALLDLPERAVAQLNVRGGGENVDPAAVAGAELLLWPGSCCVHARFKPDQLVEARRREPGALIAVHPECSPEVVRLADFSGSTSQIMAYVKAAPAGAVILVATELNMVERLGRQHPDKDIRPLKASRCGGMAKNTERDLAELLAEIETRDPVEVSDDVRRDAALSVERMLQVVAARAEPARAPAASPA